MSSPGKQLALEDASAGMILCGDLRDAQDKILLPEGATLTDAILQSLRRRGIECVTVVDDEKPDAAQEADLEAARERSRQRLTRLFRRYDGQSSPASLRLQHLINIYRSGGQP